MYCILLLSILIMIVTPGFFSYMIEILNMAKQIKKDKYQRWWVLFFFNLGNCGYQIEMCDNVEHKFSVPFEIDTYLGWILETQNLHLRV